jgi:tetratricopeptide (TPR) repeat protein
MIRQCEEIAVPATGASSKLDAVIEVLVTALIALVPVTLIARPLWGETVMLSLTAAMGLCLALKLTILRRTSLITCWSFVLGGLFLLLVVVQLAPLPRDLACAISPSLGGLKAQLLGKLPLTEQSEATMQLSFYPLATQHSLRLLLVAVTVLIVTVNVYRTPGQVKRLLGAITAIGACIAAVTLARTYFAGGENWAIWPLGDAPPAVGGYLGRVRTTQYMNLSIGAGLGLLLIKLKESSNRGDFSWSDLWGCSGGTKNLRTACCLLGAIVLCAGAGVSFGTRGAIVAMLLAGSLTLAGVSFRLIGKRRSWVFVLLTLAGLGSAVVIGLDAAAKRLGSLGGSQVGTDLRGLIDTCTAAVKSLSVIGTGLGTCDVAYPIFEQSFSPEAGFTGNHYAQLAMETGIVGISLLLVFSLILWFSYARLVGRAEQPSHFAVFGIGFALLTVIIYGFGRSGQIPFAVFVLAVILGGLVISLNRVPRPVSDSDPPGRAGGFNRFVAVVLTSVVVAASVWSVTASVNTSKAEMHWSKAAAAAQELYQSRWEDPGGLYAVLFTHASEAVILQPDNVAYRTGWNLWRWRAATRTGDAKIDQVPHTQETLATASAIVEQLEQARSLCPTYGPAYSAAGQLETYILDKPGGEENIRTGYVLSHDDPWVCFSAGMLDAREGRIEASVKKLRRCVGMDKDYISGVTEIYLRQLQRPDLAVHAAEGNITWLLHVAAELEGESAHRALAAEARSEALELAEAKCSKPGAPAWAFACAAKLYLKDGNDDRAIEYFRRALALDYAKADWRIALARALVKVGRMREALHEARICLRFRPESRSARSLVSKLCVLADATAAR